MTALKQARLRAGMTQKQAAAFLGYSTFDYRYIERHFAGGNIFCIYVMELTMRLWNKCYADRYGREGAFVRPY